ncbi:MAG: hypothetical protein ACXVRH_05935 [Thermoleophilaceae bacterium]
MATPAPVRQPVVPARAAPVAVHPKPVQRHRRRAARPEQTAPRALPHSAPSRVFNSLAAGLQPVTASTGSSGLGRDRLVLAAGALLLVMLLGGSLLLLALDETRTLRGP